MVTTDGSFGELPREAYRRAEEQTITELQRIGKPFVVLVNTSKPYSDEAKNLAAELEEQYKVKALTVNIDQMRKEDIAHILEEVMY